MRAGAGQTATVLGNNTGTPPAGYYSAGVSEGTNWLPDGESLKFGSIFLVNSATGQYIMLSYGNPPVPRCCRQAFPAPTSPARVKPSTAALNAVALARDANGDLVEATPTPNTPGVDCFVAGTLIETEVGPLPVETLGRGIRIASHNSCWRPLLARHETRLRLEAPTDEDSAHPVRIPTGFLGATRPQDRTADLLFRQREVLVPARYLVGHGATPAPVHTGRVCYHHLLLPQHEVIRAHGVLSESLFRCDVAMNAREAWSPAHGAGCGASRSAPQPTRAHGPAPVRSAGSAARSRCPRCLSADRAAVIG